MYISFLIEKSIYRDAISVTKCHSPEFPNFFVKRGRVFFTCQYRSQNIIFMLNSPTFLKKKKPDIPLNCDISGFSHSFGVRIFNWWRRFTSFQICVLLKFANSGMAIFRTFFSFLIPIMLCTCDIFSRIPEKYVI